MKPTEPAALGRGRIATVNPWVRVLRAKCFRQIRTSRGLPAKPNAPVCTTMWITCSCHPRRHSPGGKPVIVMDRIEGGTQTSCLMRESVSVSEEGAKIAELHHKIIPVAPRPIPRHDRLDRVEDPARTRYRQ
jgi:hypothetical protein